MKRDDAKQLVTDGLAELNQALASGQSETLERYLAVMSRFHRYSFGNVMLILMQREDATHVAGFHKWKELGRYVRKGEKGIAIFAPCRYKRKADDKNDDEDQGHDIRGFRVVHVWDVSQTEGDELPEFAKIHGEPGENLARMEQVIRSAGIELEYGPLLLGAKGASSGGKITLRPGLSDSETFAILVHEHAHEHLHQQNGRRHECSKTVRETEAEAVAFVVCHAFGLDSATRSSDYIQLYRGDTETLAESLQFIRKTAASIIDAIHGAELPSDEPSRPTLSPEATEDAAREQMLAPCGNFQRNQPTEDASCTQS